MSENTLTVKNARSFTFRLWMAGNMADAARELRLAAADTGMCVSLQETTYVYSGGQEDGFCLTLINYPRFPRDHGPILREIEGLGVRLMEALGQGSFTIEGPETTTYYSRRPDEG